MDPLAVRVARRFIAGKRMAPTLQDYIHMVTEDGAKIAAWKRAFVGKSLQSAKAAHQKVVTEARQPGDQRWTERVVKDADNVLRKAEAALKDIEHKFVEEKSYELSNSYYDEHNDYWDPEMFADGQTKADYAPRPLDPLFDALVAISSKYHEFWRRFEAKWDFGSMNITLSSILPADFKKQIHDANFEWLKNSTDVGLDVAFKHYEAGLKRLEQEVSRHPGGDHGHSVGMGLTSLLNEAKKAGDRWTEDFAHSLMDQLNKRPLSEKQRTLLDQKLHAYGVPPVNYKINW